MLRPFALVGAALLLTPSIRAGVAAQTADAQGSGHSGPRRVTIAAAFGGLSGAANVNEGTVAWRLGWVASVNARAWLTSNVGVRANSGWAQDSAATTSSPPCSR